MATFGEILRDLRVKAGFGLREFAKKIGMQPSNLSFIENGRAKPPRTAATLQVIASVLGLKEKSKEWEEFFDAATRRGEIPADLKENADVAEFLPILCRTLTTTKLTRDEITSLIDRMKNYRAD